MLITCTTKGCLQVSEAKLDRDSGEVICDECGNDVSNITSFTKKALLTIGQVLRHSVKKPFSSVCEKCGTRRDLEVKKDKAHCTKCGSHVVVSAAFLHGLKTYLEQDSEKETKAKVKEDEKQ